MASLTSGGLRHLRCQRLLSRGQWARSTPSRRHEIPFGRRAQSTQTEAEHRALQKKLAANTAQLIEATAIPHQGVTHARPVPDTPSYFSKDPRFNELYVRAAKLLTKYYHLPTIIKKEAGHTHWLKLTDLRAGMGERVKAAHFAKVMRVVKRLNLIEPSMKPTEVKVLLGEFMRAYNPWENRPKPIIVDKYGRAVGVGRRKASTARAFVVEGTGEVQVNGKPLNEAFGRVHDRESAIWALIATERMDKYNIWALVEGGGTTGQAEALTLAVAKALVAHEPALKTALRKAGCITRDKRTVERKKHGLKGARRGQTWVKR